jgi:hypothetical protein
VTAERIAEETGCDSNYSKEVFPFLPQSRYDLAPAISYIKGARPEANHSSPSSAKVNILIPPHILISR